MGAAIVIAQVTRALVRWVAPKEWNRTALVNVCFEPDGRQVATNGHGLALWTPAADGPTPAIGADHRRLLPGRLVQRIIQMLAEWTPQGPSRAVEMVEADADARGIVPLHIGSQDGAVQIEAQVAQPWNPYPAWEKAIPQGNPEGHVRLRMEYLRTVVESFADIADIDEVVVSIYGEKQPMTVVGESAYGTLTIVLPPQRPLEERIPLDTAGISVATGD